MHLIIDEMHIFGFFLTFRKELGDPDFLKDF